MGQPKLGAEQFADVDEGAEVDLAVHGASEDMMFEFDEHGMLLDEMSGVPIADWRRSWRQRSYFTALLLYLHWPQFRVVAANILAAMSTAFLWLLHVAQDIVCWMFIVSSSVVCG
jgi:hypothetical protein